MRVPTSYICLCVSPGVSVCLCVPLCFFVCLCVSLCVSLTICLSVRLSVCLSPSLSLSLSLAGHKGGGHCTPRTPVVHRLLTPPKIFPVVARLDGWLNFAYFLFTGKDSRQTLKRDATILPLHRTSVCLCLTVSPSLGLSVRPKGNWCASPAKLFGPGAIDHCDHGQMPRSAQKL